jgi:hypothetical protein
LSGGIVWALGFLIAFGLGEVLGNWFERHTVGGIASAGFLGIVIAWAVGATLAAFVGFGLVSGVVRAAAAATLWGLSFLVSTYLAVVLAYVLSQVFKIAVQQFVGSQASFLAGWAVGYAVAGLTAAGAVFLISRPYSARLRRGAG